MNGSLVREGTKNTEPEEKMITRIKEGSSAEPSKKPFDADEFIAHIFSSIPKQNINDWQGIRQKAREFILIISDSVMRVCIQDEHTIQKIFCDAFFSSGYEGASKSIYLDGCINQYFSTKSAEEIIDTLLKIAKNCHFDAAIKLLADEMDQDKFTAHIKLIEQVIRNESSCEYIIDWLVIHAFMLKQNMVETYIDQLEAELQNYVNQLPIKSDLTKLYKHQNGSYLLAQDSNNPYKNHKILSGFFYQLGAKKWV
jgi:hypothetical protein